MGAALISNVEVIIDDGSSHVFFRLCDCMHTYHSFISDGAVDILGVAPGSGNAILNNGVFAQTSTLARCNTGSESLGTVARLDLVRRVARGLLEGNSMWWFCVGSR